MKPLNASGDVDAERVRARSEAAMDRILGNAFYRGCGLRQIAAHTTAAATIHAAEVLAAALDRLTAALERGLPGR